MNPSWKRLLDHIRLGASMAVPIVALACSGDGGPGSGTGGTGGALTGGAGGGAAGGLPPLPESLSCEGPVYDAGFGYHGQCCERLVCHPRNADGSCPPEGNSYGSGRCACGAGGGGGASGNVRGPFASAPERDAGAAGECCYVSRSIGCDGRPLHVASEARVAPRAARGDWC
jgi:hypothetical protein